MPARVHSKLKDKRPDDYTFVMAHLNATLRSPDFVGRDAKHPGRINLVREVANDQRHSLLVSIGETRSTRGRYIVATAYPFARAKIESRLRQGAFRQTKKAP